MKAGKKGTLLSSSILLSHEHAPYLPFLYILNNDIDSLKPLLGSHYLLHFAAFFRKLEIMEMIIKNGAEVDSGYCSVTPLHLAVMNNQREAVERLIDLGADISAVHLW